MKKYRVFILIGAILLSLFAINQIYSSRMFFHNMYLDTTPFDINIYAQIISVFLFIVILVLMMRKQLQPIALIIVGLTTVILNTGALIVYVSMVEDFYVNIYIVRGIVLLLIGIFLRNKNGLLVKQLSLYFVIEFLIFQVAASSQDSILYMEKTFEANLFGATLIFLLGILIPIGMHQFLVEDKQIPHDKQTVSLGINQLITISAWISIALLVILIVLNIPYLFDTLVDASMRTILYYQLGAVLRIALYCVFIYGFVMIIKKSVPTWFVPMVFITILVTTIFPFTFDIDFYIERFDRFIGLFIDLFVLLMLVITMYLKQYRIAFIASLWFVLNIVLAPIIAGNIQQYLVFIHIYRRTSALFIEILYYFIPITLSLVLYRSMRMQKEAQ